jgi:hypothetical protein
VLKKSDDRFLSFTSHSTPCEKDGFFPHLVARSFAGEITVREQAVIYRQPASVYGPERSQCVKLVESRLRVSSWVSHGRTLIAQSVAFAHSILLLERIDPLRTEIELRCHALVFSHAANFPTLPIIAPLVSGTTLMSPWFARSHVRCLGSLGGYALSGREFEIHSKNMFGRSIRSEYHRLPIREQQATVRTAAESTLNRFFHTKSNPSFGQRTSLFTDRLLSRKTRGRYEASEFPFEMFSEGYRRPILEIRTDDLHANRQASR